MSLKFQSLCLFFFLLGMTRLEATNVQPWLGNIYEFEAPLSLRLQSYSELSSGFHSIKYPSTDFFLNGSLSNALPFIGLEIEAKGAWTRKQRGDLDQLKLTGRYIWLDDIAGDPLSVAIGLSYIQAFHKSLKDPSSFHHGRSEAELFLSVGKENSMDVCRRSRWWSVLGIGAAVGQGSPWLRFDLAYEKCWAGKHELRGFIDSLWGLGAKRFLLAYFHGYGAVQHRSIDLGLRYTYLIDFFGSAGLEYSYRVYARNFPVYSHQVLAQLLFTFGL